MLNQPITFVGCFTSFVDIIWLHESLQNTLKCIHESIVTVVAQHLSLRIERKCFVVLTITCTYINSWSYSNYSNQNITMFTFSFHHATCIPIYWLNQPVSFYSDISICTYMFEMKGLSRANVLLDNLYTFNILKDYWKMCKSILLLVLIF